jgi:cell filamentation protein
LIAAIYDAVNDPYCYPGTKVLKNRASIRRANELRQFELAMTTQRFDEPLPGGRFSVSHYCAVHHHLFQDVYTWAGKFRSVRISRRGSAFCYPENIAKEMHRLFADLDKRSLLRGLPQKEFAVQAAHFLAELNAIHAFRDGNGRSQLAFVIMLADRAGHPFALAGLRPAKFLKAMVASFFGNEKLLAAELSKLVRR